MIWSVRARSGLGAGRLGVGQSFAKFREKFARGAAGAEIFRNLPLMFGDQQWATLGDYIQSALMLSYNGRAVG